MAINYQLDADPQKALDSISKVVAKQEMLIQKLRDTGQAGKETSQSFEGIADALGGLVGPAAIFVAMTAELGRIDQKAQDLIAHFKELGAASKDIVINSNSLDLAQDRIDFAKRIAALEGVPEREMMETVAIAQRYGFTDDEVQGFAKLESAVPDVSDFAAGVGGIGRTFPGAGTPGEIQGMLLRAAQEHAVPVDSLIKTILQSSQSGKRLGGSFEEIAALAATSLGNAPSLEEGASDMNSLLDKLAADKRFVGGEGLAADMARAAELSEKQKEKLFGKNGIGPRNALDLFQGSRDEFTATLEALAAEKGLTGSDYSISNQKINMLEEIPDIAIYEAVEQQQIAKRARDRENAPGLIGRKMVYDRFVEDRERERDELPFPLNALHYIGSKIGEGALRLAPEALISTPRLGEAILDKDKPDPGFIQTLIKLQEESNKKQEEILQTMKQAGSWRDRWREQNELLGKNLRQGIRDSYFPGLEAAE